MNLLLGSFIAAYLLFFNCTIFTLFSELFIDVYIFLLSSFNMFSDILRLFISNYVIVI